VLFGEKSPMRLAQLNGYHDRDWETPAPNVELRIPKLRKGSYFPSFLEPRRMGRRLCWPSFRKPTFVCGRLPLASHFCRYFRSDRLLPYVRPLNAVAHDHWPRWFPQREFPTR